MKQVSSVTHFLMEKREMSVYGTGFGWCMLSKKEGDLHLFLEKSEIPQASGEEMTQSKE